MAKKSKKMGLEQVAGIVENEGLGYAVQHYMSGEDIADKKLAKLWDEAKVLLNEIDEILEPYQP